jgi:hypothetical protein
MHAETPARTDERHGINTDSKHRSATRHGITLEGKMKNGKSACFTTDYTDFDGFHGEISLFSNELTAHPAG